MKIFYALLILTSLAISQAPSSPKPTRVQHMMYDTQQKQIVLLSSVSESGREAVWNWNGKEWKLSSAPGPPAREASAAVYDTRRNRIVLFGGIGIKGEDDRLGDLWESKGSVWQQQATTSNETRDHHFAAFDESRGRVVVYGGQPRDRSWLTDTSEWDGTNWTKLETPGPGGRVHFAMAYDSRRKRVLLFGGFDQSFKAHNDLWAWDGKSWQKLSEGGPSIRSHHAMAFDTASNVLVLFGGARAAKPTDALDDTWLWDGQQWKEIKSVGPPKRYLHLMAYDVARRKTVLYGGSSMNGQIVTRYQDTWEWDGSRWQQVN